MRKHVKAVPFLILLLLPGCFRAIGDSESRPQLFVPAPGSPFPVGSAPTDVAAGDVNGDGKLDLVTANASSNDLSILLGDGRGGFRAGPPLDAGPRPHLVALADFNRDAKLDLAVTEHDSNNVRILLGTAGGRFERAPGSPFAALNTTNPHNHGLRAGFINDDAHLDITTSNQNDHSVSILLGDGRGGFAPSGGSPFRTGRAPYPHTLADVNKDGKTDIVTPDVGGNTLTVLLGDGKGAFAPAAGSPMAVAPRPYFVAAGDLNNDGVVDLVATHDDISLVTLLLGNGRGAFRPAPGSPQDIGARAAECALGDVNGDGRLDFVAGMLNTVAVWRGDGSGRFRPAPGSPYPVGRGGWAVALADLNKDDKLDVIVASVESNNVTVLLGR